MMEFMLGMLGMSAAAAVGNAVNKKARRMGRAVGEFGKMAERVRSSGRATTCAITGIHGWTTRIGIVGDDNIEHMTCHDCGATWDQPYGD